MILQTVVVLEGAIHKPTIVRVRGCVRVQHPGVIVGGQAFGLGLLLMQDTEVTGGTFPGPLTAADDDRFLWHHCGFVQHRASVGGFAQESYEDVKIDSKAMRIWEENKQLVLLMENSDLIGTTSTILGQGFFRMLLKLA